MLMLWSEREVYMCVCVLIYMFIYEYTHIYVYMFACMLSCFNHVQLGDPMDCCPPGSSVHGILQTRIPEWVAMPFSPGFLTQGLNLGFLCLLHWQAGSPGDPLEKGMATHSSILAWRTPWTEEPGGLQFIGSQSRTGLK